MTASCLQNDNIFSLQKERKCIMNLRKNIKHLQEGSNARLCLSRIHYRTLLGEKESVSPGGWIFPWITIALFPKDRGLNNFPIWLYPLALLALFGVISNGKVIRSPFLNIFPEVHNTFSFLLQGKNVVILEA